MKKFTAIILALVLMFSLSATALAADNETKVTVTVSSTNISVTVPMSISIEAKVDGGAAQVPDNYKFENNSRIPVKVDTIAVAFKVGTTDWAFKDAPLAEKVNPTNPDKNEIHLSINGQVLAEQSATAPTTPTSWNIAPHDGTDAGTLALPVVASTSRLNTTETANDLITITYVVSAGSH